MKKIIVITIFISLFYIPFSTFADQKWCNVPQINQEHSQWCWAGCSAMILSYWGKSTSGQCGMANWAFGRNDCCGSSYFNWNHVCNSPNNMYNSNGSIQAIIGYYNIGSTGYAGYLDWSNVQSHINRNRPFVIRWGYSNGGGHFVICRGWSTDNGGYYMAINNPWPGEGQSWPTYAWVKSGSSWSWTHTLWMH